MSLAGRLRQRVPEPLKPPLRGLAGIADRAVLATERLRRTPPDPVPPRRVRASVGQPSRVRYREEGELVAGDLQRLLSSLGTPIGSFRSVCDLASGPGKILQRIDFAPATAVSAIDVNQEAISWLAANTSNVDARAEGPWPPTSFPADAFDLIYSVSLFTHLSEAAQDAWLGEISRLLAPGGLGMITVHGTEAFEGFKEGRRPGISDTDRRALGEVGSLAQADFLFLPEPDPERRSPGVKSDWGLAFHGAEYLRLHWGAALTVEEIIPASLNFKQDVVLVRATSATERDPALS